MLLELYVNNYKCLQNFTLHTKNAHSLMLAGRNGAGKSALIDAIGIFQSIGRGESKIANIIFPDNLTAWSNGNKISFRLKVLIQGHIYEYRLD